MFRRFARLVLFLKWPLLLALIAWTALLGNSIRSLHIDPSTDSLFNKNTVDYQYYREFSEKFGSDHIIAVAMDTPDLFTNDYLDRLRTVTDDLSQLKGVERVLSLSNAMDIKHKFLGIKVVPALEEVYKGNESPQDVKENILSNELYVNNLISRDGRIANIVVYLKPVENNRDVKDDIVGNLRGRLTQYEDSDVKFYVAGAPIEQHDFIEYIRRDQFVFIPVISILLIITTWGIYRSFACMFLAMSIVFVTLVWSLGTIALLGQDLNLVTSLLAPVIMIVAVVNSIHLMNLFFEIRPHHPDVKDAVIVTIGQLGKPCFLTHFTTILGFMSLALSPIPAIRSFGLFASMGTFYSFAVEMLLTPILLPMLPYRRVSDDGKVSHFFNRFLVEFLEKLEWHWKWWILLFTAGIIVFSIVGIKKIEIDTNMIEQMKPDSPLAVATRFIDENLTGVYVLGFVFQKKDGTPHNGLRVASKD